MPWFQLQNISVTMVTHRTNKVLIKVELDLIRWIDQLIRSQRSTCCPLLPLPHLVFTCRSVRSRLRVLGFPRPAARGFTTATAISLPTEGGKLLSTLTWPFRNWSITCQSQLTWNRQVNLLLPYSKLIVSAQTSQNPAASI